MIYDMTNLSLFQHACRGTYAPRDKYIFDRSVAEGHLRVTIQDDLTPEFSFAEYSGDVEPTPSNIEDTLKSLKFYSKDAHNAIASYIRIGVKHLSKITYEELTEELVMEYLNRHYEDLILRKGSNHFHSIYAAELMKDPANVAEYFRNGGKELVF